MKQDRKNSFLASNIKFLRRLHGLTQSQLAEKLTISRSNIAAFESGLVQPSSSIFVQLAQLFEIHPVQFVETNLSEKIPQTLHVNEQNLSIKQKYIYDHLGEFIQETNQLTRILEGYLAFEKLRKQESNLDPTGLSSFYKDLLHLFEIGVKNNWSLISSITAKEEE